MGNLNDCSIPVDIVLVVFDDGSILLASENIQSEPTGLQLDTYKFTAKLDLPVAIRNRIFELKQKVEENGI
jgi:hypothetical protein